MWPWRGDVNCTRRAVGLLAEAQRCREDGRGARELLALGAQLTDANAALFDDDRLRRRHGYQIVFPRAGDGMVVAL